MVEVGLVLRIFNNLSLNCAQNALHICNKQNASTYFVTKWSMTPKKQQNEKLWCWQTQSVHCSLNPSCPRNCNRPVSSSAAFSGTSKDRHNQFCKQRELEQYKLAATKVPQSVPKNALFLAAISPLHGVGWQKCNTQHKPHTCHSRLSHYTEIFWNWR